MPLEVQSRNWLKVFKSILYKCFRKIRVTNNVKKKDVKEKIIFERIELKKKSKLNTISEDMKIKIEERISQIEQEIGNEISERYHQEIVETLREFGGDEHNLNGSGRKKLWEKLKQK